MEGRALPLHGHDAIHFGAVESSWYGLQCQVYMEYMVTILRSVYLRRLQLYLAGLRAKQRHLFLSSTKGLRSRVSVPTLVGGVA